MSKITFFWAEYCSGCHELEPIVKELAKDRGWDFESVDVEGCDTPECEGLEWIPAVFLDGRQLKLRELERLINEE